MPNLSDASVRLATVDDLPAVNGIYNHYVTHSTATAQTQPETIQARRSWFDAHGPNHPVTVVSAGGIVLGWGALSRFHAREAFARSVENSLYIDPAHHRRGFGRLILLDLLRRASDLGHRTVIAVISGDQTASLLLHEQLGFEMSGRIKDAGYKLDRWFDVVYMQKMM